MPSFKSLSYYCLLLLPISSLIGQRCLVEESYHDEQLRDKLEAFSLKTQEGEHAISRTNIEIPVVVHVVWHHEEENISEEQIHSQLEALNRDFSLLNEDTVLAPDLFKPLISNPKIVFKLAEIDPEGNSTNGITRTETPFEDIGIPPKGNGSSPIYYTEEGGKDAWNPKWYLNIWVADMPEEPIEAVGFATRPGQRIPEEDGIIVDYLHFGTVGRVKKPYHLGRTLVHEVGHYLNLLHLNGNHSQDCSKDDGVEDTPFQTKNYFECQTDFVATCDSEDLTVNYMNLVDDECMVMFTKGQVERMMSALLEARSELLNPSVSTKNIDQSPIQLTITPNPARHQILLRLEDIAEAHYHILNAQGQLIQEGNLTQSIMPIAVNSFPKGVYIVVVQFQKETITTKLVLY